MDHRQRFSRVMRFEPVDRLPMIEWAGWWDKTIARWKKEGLPVGLEDAAEIRESLGLDVYRQCWIDPSRPTLPSPTRHGKPIASGAAEYVALKEHLYPDRPFDPKVIEQWAALQERGDAVVWISLEGFFWFPRRLLGIERHLGAFYERPELIRLINDDLLEFNLAALDRFRAICTPDFMTFAEDMSYRSGPMISQALFEEFLAPYYRKIVPRIKDHGIIPFVDTDGNIESLVPWFADLGIEGFLPLERQAGVDVAALRARHPHLKMIGGFDKMVMSHGEETMRAEFERLLPVMKQGGYIPSVDHQTPPDVSFAQYKIYLQFLRDYCRQAGSASES